MIESIWEQLRASLWNAVWAANLAALHPARAGAVGTMRVAHMVAREIGTGQLTLRAMSLVYTTLLSLVPLLAVSFSVLKGFGVHDQLEPTLLNLLAPLGEKSVEITERIVGFVENVRVGLLGSVGLALLLYTVISLLQKIERAFNYTWRVHRERGLGQRFSDYLSVLLVGPLLVFSAIGVTATVASSSVTRGLLEVQALGWLVEAVSALVPFLLVIVAFAFVYMYLPNTKVRVRPAFTGALVAGVLWQVVGWTFATFVVKSTSATAAIYSSFAILVIFMLWLYLSWLTLLIGASVAFYTQHPEYLGLLVDEMRVSNRMRERLALQCAFEIARRHYYGLPPIPTAGLAAELGVPVDPVREALAALAARGILVEALEGEPTYVPARDLALITLDEVLDVVRAADESAYLNEARLRTDEAVESIVHRLASAREGALRGQTLREIAAENPPSERAARSGGEAEAEAPAADRRATGREAPGEKGG